MARQLGRLFVVFAFMFALVGVTLAADDAEVVSFSKGKLVMRSKGKNETVTLRGIKVTDSGGTELKAAKLTKALKKGAKLALVRDSGKITMIVVK